MAEPSFPKPIDLRKLKVYPLAERRSMSRIEDILIDPNGAPPPARSRCANRSRNVQSTFRPRANVERV